MIQNKTFRKWYFKLNPVKFTEKLSKVTEEEYRELLKTASSPQEREEVRYRRDNDMEIIEDDLGIYLSNKLIYKAEKYGIPLLEPRPDIETEEKVSDYWALSVYHFYYLSKKGRYDLRKKIEEEKTIARGKISHFIFLASGLIGIATGFLSILKGFI